MRFKNSCLYLSLYFCIFGVLILYLRKIILVSLGRVNLLPKIVIIIDSNYEAFAISHLVDELKRDEYQKQFKVLIIGNGKYQKMFKDYININLMYNDLENSSLFHKSFEKFTNEFKKLNKKSLVVVQGDTTIALAASLAASYLHIPLAHIQNGEIQRETNKKLINYLSRLFITPTKNSKQTLINQGICPSDIFINEKNYFNSSKKIAKIFQDFLSGILTRNKSCTTKFRQDLLARKVFSPKNITFNKLESYTTRKDKLLNRTKPRERLTMSEIFSLPSRYNITQKNYKEFSLTAIVSLYRRTGLVRRFLESFINQTHPPEIIWFVYFASPVAKELDIEIEEAKLWLNQTGKKVSLFVNKGDMQLKYFGRFQLALQVKTKYVVLFDDDCVPQNRFFEACMHTINTRDYNGILGTKGTPFAENYFYGPVSGSETITEIDVIGGSWFMESDWVKLMFRDEMLTWETAEDFQICANARKYADIRSFVMPVSKNDTSTNSFSIDYLNISYKGDTNGDVQIHRHNLRMKQYERGDRYVDSYLRNEKTLTIFAEEYYSARFLLQTFHKYINLPIEIAIAVHKKIDVSWNLEEMRNIRNFSFFNNFMIGNEFRSKISDLSQAAETLYQSDIVFQMTQSTALMIMGSFSSSASIGIVTAAKLLKIPIINFYYQKDVQQTHKRIIKTLSDVNILVNENEYIKYEEILVFEKFLQSIF
ncbi:unnamed protein product [Brachionus calyciflorus]|uniref:UDP-N-acetylglucosamine 2-epimerase domain-containing protein n=1 Tax=Brachionus calyciflorus TaxID=104777 RepID=A0A814H8L1_9BILA|nr:unnamed protein product [Brachionus calyciflorus]